MPGLFPLADLRAELVSREFISGANQHLAALNDGFDTRSHQRPLRAGGGNGQPTRLRFTHNCLRQRVSGTLLDGGGQRQQCVIGGIHPRHLRFADRQRAGLIERNLLNLA
ncbi:hypothetical protein D3C86_1900620 [compost metagenome]